MNTLPGALGGNDLVAWRLDRSIYAATWDSGAGAYRSGGRWNSAGRSIVYCALDPALAILEVAVHKGFDTLDTVSHTLTSISIAEASLVHIVDTSAIPNPHWLRPGTPSKGQQLFGDDLLANHAFVVLPSVVSAHSWNLLFDPARAAGNYALLEQEHFALDTRLNPPVLPHRP